jgi:hypothetical protein
MRRFLHALALRLGVPVHRLIAEMPAHELSDWMIYFRDEAKQQTDLPGVDSVGAEGFAAAMGADVGALSDGSESR